MHQLRLMMRKKTKQNRRTREETPTCSPTPTRAVISSAVVSMNLAMFSHFVLLRVRYTSYFGWRGKFCAICFISQTIFILSLISDAVALRSDLVLWFELCMFVFFSANQSDWLNL